eukprot:COSAG06_NODE_56582_length_284_cov_0.713514_1_plen_61_part_10
MKRGPTQLRFVPEATTARPFYSKACHHSSAGRVPLGTSRQVAYLISVPRVWVGDALRTTTL